MKLDKFEVLTISGGALMLILAMFCASSSWATTSGRIPLCVCTASGCGPDADCPTGTGEASPGSSVEKVTLCGNAGGGVRCMTVSAGGSNEVWHTPAGWPAVNTPPGTATPSDIHFDCSVPPGIAGNGAASAGACAAQIDANMIITYGNAQRHVCSYSVGGTVCQSDAVGSCASPTCSGNMTQVTVCPAGYSGPSCALSSPTLVQRPADSILNIKRTGDVMSTDPQDAADLAATPPLFVTQQKTAVACEGTDCVAVTIDERSVMTVTKTHDNGDGTSTRTVTTLAPPNSDHLSAPVTSTVTGTYTGNGFGVGTPPPATSTATCGAPGQAACAMDTSGMPSDTGLPGAQSAFDSAAAAREASISGVNGGTIEGHETTLLSYFTQLGAIEWPQGSCTNPSFGVGGHVGTVPLCEHADDIKNGIGWLFGVWSAFSCAFAALRAIKGA